MPLHLPIVALEKVSRVFPQGNCVALREVDFSVAHGEYWAVTGPSGSGKSTLLHMLGGLDRPTSGRVLFEGRPINGRGEWARIRARRIGFVFQTFQLLPTLTAWQNVEVPMLGVIRGGRQRRQRAEELLGGVGLKDRIRHRPTELSGGERQRLAIARSLANSPDLLLADEPTGNLDSETTKEILNLLERIHEQRGLTLVIVTHDREIAARAKKRLVLKDGRIQSTR